MKKGIILFYLVLCGAILLWGDQRKGNLDLFLVLDKSLSMEEEIEEVKTYVSNFLLDKLLIPGDRVLAISFYGEAEILYQGSWGTAGENTQLLDALQNLSADGRFTDIGNALDRLRTALPTFPADPERRRYFLLLTDGIQEAPPESPYYSPDGTFNHFFLENIKVLRDEGWKVIVLGIGTQTAAKELADSLAGGYSTFEEAKTSADTESGEEDFLGIFSLTEEATLFYNSQQSQILLSVIGTGYLESKAIRIQQAILSDSSGRDLLLTKDFETDPLTADKIYELKIPGNGLILAPEETYTLKLSYYGQHQIVPAQFPIQLVQKKNITTESSREGQAGESQGSSINLWVILIAAAVLIVLFIVIFFIRTYVPADEDQKKKKKKGLME